MPTHDWTRVEACIFHDFHLEWISSIKRSLNGGLLPANYYALAEQIARGLHPDVLTLERKRFSSAPGNGAPAPAPNDGGVALAEETPRVRFTASAELEQYARKRSRLAVRHISDDAVVAIVEIVSPGNKSNRHALRSFVDKSLAFLDAGIHLLLVDLFPPGPRDPQGIHGAIWSEIGDDDFRLPSEALLTLAAYCAGAVTRAFIEPVAVGASLPDMPLYLEPGGYVSVPREATYQAAFEGVPRRWREELEPPTTR